MARRSVIPFHNSTNSTPGLNIPIVIQLRLLCRFRYAHRSTCRNFVYHQQSEQCLPSIWTLVAQPTRHRSTVTTRPLYSKQEGNRGVDPSLLRPLQRHFTTTTPPPHHPTTTTAPRHHHHHHPHHHHHHPVCCLCVVSAILTVGGRLCMASHLKEFKLGLDEFEV